MPHTHIWLRALPAALAAAVTASLALVAGQSGASVTEPPTGPSIVDPRVYASVADGDDTEFLVSLSAADLSGAERLTTKREKTTYVHQQLTSHAEATQVDIRAMLASRDIPYTSFWITNSLLVTGGRELIDELATMTGVVGINPNESLPLARPVKVAAPAGTNGGLQQNIADINADRAWQQYGTHGQQIVVAAIDTGADFDHPLLLKSYRGTYTGGHDYNWVDFTGVCDPTGVPCDDDGHGTHVTGIMAGSGGIGVAPGAVWIAAKACEHDDTPPPGGRPTAEPTTEPLSQPHLVRSNGKCPPGAVLKAAQWMLAPTDLAGEKPDPSKAPDIINNSYGACPARGTHPDIKKAVDAWVAAGIYPVFAAGNCGRDGCETLTDNANYLPTHTVGAYDSLSPTREIADFSSKGHGTSDGQAVLKPDLAAPGVGIISAAVGGELVSADGTSMAAPHLAGAVALMWSAAPAVRGQVATTRQVLNGTTRRTQSFECAHLAGNLGSWINLAYGFGRLDALAAVQAVADPHPLQAEFNFGCAATKRCAFHASGTGPILTYTWDFGDSVPTPDRHGRPISHDYPAAGTYQVTLTVRSLAGATHTVTKPVTVP